VFRAAVLDGISRLVDDNLQHLELRGIPKVYTQGRIYSEAETLDMFLDILSGKLIHFHSFIEEN
jgi:hypothetical protein